MRQKSAERRKPSREDHEELGRIVHEILRLVIGLQSGTVESARELADGAAWAHGLPAMWTRRAFFIGFSGGD